MNTTTWKPVPREEWTARLHAARTVAIERLAKTGLRFSTLHGDGADVDDLITFGPLGDALSPGLARTQHVLDCFRKRTGDPAVFAGPDSELSTVLFDYATQIARAAYLFGVISGTVVSWPVVEALDPPSAPPVAASPSARESLT